MQVGTKSLDIFEHDKLNSFILKALALHGLFILLAVLSSHFLELDWFKNDKEIKAIKIIQSSVRIDVVAMPTFTVKELKKMKIAAPSSDVKDVVKAEKEAPSKDQTKSELEFKQKAKKVNLSNLLNNLSKKKTPKNKKKRVKGTSVSKSYQKQLRSLVLEGNKVNDGTSLVGDGLAQDNGVFEKYVSALPNFVRPYWKLPSYLLDQGLQCRIRIYLAANGSILRAVIYESSGVDEFDKRALVAIKKISSFPPPGRQILPRVASGEVILGFPL